MVSRPSCPMQNPLYRAAVASNGAINIPSTSPGTGSDGLLMVIKCRELGAMDGSDVDTNYRAFALKPRLYLVQNGWFQIAHPLVEPMFDCDKRNEPDRMC